MPRVRDGQAPSAKGLLARLGLDHNDQPKQLAIRELVQPAELSDLLCNVLEMGGAVMFSRTSDGGALAVTFFLDDQRLKRYVTTREQWEAIVQLTGQ